VLFVFDEILWAVNPKRDGLHDFITYVCNYAEKFLRVKSIQCFLDVASDLPASGLNLPLRRGLLMVTKEALNNVVKHSGAAELKLKIHCERERLILSLEDNGRGFDPMKTDNQRNGLNNMAERMAELGGTFLIVSQPGKGCKIEISALLKQPRWRFWAN
jgi:signal transduction histidine kinase